jgi:large subunit ribosomal protein L21
MNTNKFFILDNNGKQIRVLEGAKFFLDFNKQVSNGEMLKIKKVFDSEKGIVNEEINVEVVNSKVSGDKVIIFKKKRRKGYERKTGFRAKYTQCVVRS